MRIDKNWIIGVGIVFLIALFSDYLSSLEIFKKLAISPLVIGIVIGAILANSIYKFLTPYESGFIFSGKKILRFAIIFYGFRITLQEILDVGLSGFLSALIMVTTTFITGYIVGKRIVKLDQDSSILISSGASICGAAAVLATEPVVKASEEKVAIAVSMVVLFGTISLFFYPILYNFLVDSKVSIFSLDPKGFGIYTGATVHEVAQVVAIGSINGADTIMAKSAVIVKMSRVLLIAPFLILLGIYLLKRNRSLQNSSSKITIPWFAIFFIVVACFNSLDILPKKSVELINNIDTFLLTMAMSALGLHTRFSKFKAFGIKPLYLASILYIWLVVGGFFVVKLLRSYLG